ncbi:hypothetical protein AQUCO_00300077v1 [Aquilegia coerulea]|uniref:Factor of DNA methylation 1-5/IDN2 domain-containing protein n=1 Tax=Aquilegia coerulea TaxID=218851 RepID=A0A2G5EX42_AQUCA|nr:hypothetical protein AQUCO_00300077v1 [Aquilegia coerulea]
MQLKTMLVEKEGNLQNLRKQLEEKTEDMQDVRRKLYVMEENPNMLNKQLEEKTADMEDMVSVNQVLTVKERMINDELQGAYIELKNELQDVLGPRSGIGFKLMGELNIKPFQDVCRQKFPSEEYDVKSAELCSMWQENIKNQEWYPFKRIQANGKLVDEKLVQLNDAWGEEVHKAVCVWLCWR